MTPRPTHLCQLAGVWRGEMPDGGLMHEEKVDGWRAVYLPDHKGRWRLFTRNGMPIEGVGHILWRLDAMREAAGEPTVFDGEFQVDGSLEATKRWCETDWKRGGEAGQFFAFDALPLSEWQAGGTDRPAIERKAALAKCFAEAEGDGWEWRPGSRGRDETGPPAVVLLDDGWCFDARDVVTNARRVWAMGREGLMLKDPLGGYRRLRSDAWQKVKACNKWMRQAA